MLLIDGAKFQEWKPQKEVEEFHPLVREHFKEIFGYNSIIIDGNILKSDVGTGSKPDWFVITFGDAPQWHIVEAELSSHPLYDHIVNQVGRFINGIKNSNTQKRVIDSLYNALVQSKVLKAELEEAIKPNETYKFLSDLISRLPVLTIIIEEKTPDLEEALDLLRYSPIKTVEFKTFRRVEAEAVHAHLFEPIYPSSNLPVIKNQSESLPVQSSETSLITKRYTSGISLKDLLDSKTVKANQEIYGEHKGKTYTGKILENGRIWVDSLSRDFPSLSGAAIATKNVESEDGWRWWYIKDVTGKECSLNNLREKYKQSHNL